LSNREFTLVVLGEGIRKRQTEPAVIHSMLEKIIRDFMTIWTTIDPISNLALFAGLTAAMHRSERRRIAWRASVYAAIVLVVAVIVGQIILDAMGIRLRSLQIAGGLILFVFGLQMVFGWIGETGTSVEKGRDLAVFPMAVPAIAGPGAITAVILLTDNDAYSVPERAETAVVLLIVLALNYLLLLLSDVILHFIGRSGAAILTRVMGIILTALSVEFVLAGLSIGNWATPHH
jgi:multiple antibiotic resistance protein